MTASINGTTGVTFPDASVQATAATGFGFKNRIINGDFRIDQRNAGASAASNAYTLDRWNAASSQSSKYTVQQNAGSVTPPVGFTNYLGVTSSSAYSIGSTDYFFIQQAIEGLNVSDLSWGTANAKTVTLSFQVYSSLTGTFGGAITNSARNRSYPFSYSIPVANTWTPITVTISGDTTGTWLTTNGVGMWVQFGFGVGSTYSGTAGSWSASGLNSATGAVSVVGTSGATFYITGVQLEKGSTATSFDYRPYGTELALCQRYYQNFVASTQQAIWFGFYGASGNNYSFPVVIPITMRSSPTITMVGTFATQGLSSNNPITVYTSPNILSMYWACNSTGHCYAFNHANEGYTLSAEL